MKKVLTTLLIITLFISCKQQTKVGITYITQKFNEKMDTVNSIQYNVQNSMLFSDGNKWDNSGFAVIEKNPNDTIFGFSFYGFKNEINKSSIYKEGIGFEISNKNKSFKQEKQDLHFLGSNGGQMIYKDFFKLDSIYKNVKVTETENNYVVNYVFEDDLKNKRTEIEKILEIDKKTFLPKKVIISSQLDFGGKQSTSYIFENLKINKEVDKSIADYIFALNNFELIIDEAPKPNALLNKPLPPIALKNLIDQNETVEIKIGQITLIDFWEVWCGPCIASFPKVENLKSKFGANLNIVGIVASDKENAIKLVEKKEVTFLNLIGTKIVLKTFSVNSYPRYFLIDKDGIIRNEYFGFSPQIEKDIEELLGM